MASFNASSLAAERAWENMEERGTGKMAGYAISTKIQSLVAAQNEARAVRRTITKDLRNERRRKARLMSRTKGLTNADIILMLAERKMKKERNVSPPPVDDVGGNGATGSGSGGGTAS